MIYKIKMFSNLLNSIPVVGHVKGICHYVTGDIEEGNNAMLGATRTTLVIGAGVAGSLGGPAGAVAAGAAARTLCDSVTSVANDQPEGIVNNFCDITDDIVKGKIPLKPTASLALAVCGDGLDELSEGIRSAIFKKSAGKATANIASKMIRNKVPFHSIASETESVVVKECLNKVHSSSSGGTAGRPGNGSYNISNYETILNNSQINSNKTSHGNTRRTSGPPQNSRDRNNEEHYAEDDFLNIESDFEEFFKIFFNFKYGRRFYEIFRILNEGQKNYLKLLIENMKFGGRSKIESIIEIVTKLFDRLQIDFTFEHFVSLSSFVLAYIEEEIEALRRINYDPSCYTFGNFENQENDLFQRVTKNRNLINSMESIIRNNRI